MLFMGGRYILDAVLIAHESIDSRLRNGILGVVCKTDRRKAYDHLRWNFLLYVLEKIGFGLK